LIIKQCFLDITRASNKYDEQKNAYHYDHAVQNNRSVYHIDTLTYIAHRAGLELTEILQSNNLTTDPLFSHTCARVREEFPEAKSFIQAVCLLGTGREKKRLIGVCIARDTKGKQSPRQGRLPLSHGTEHLPADYPSNEASKEEPEEDLLVDDWTPPEGYPDYAWPQFLQRLLSQTDNKEQQDILFLFSIGVLGTTLDKLLSFVYGRQRMYPSFLMFVVAPPATGKSVLLWAKELGMPLDNQRRIESNQRYQIYRKEMEARAQLGKEKAQAPMPEEPPFRQFYVPADNSSTGLIDNIIESDGNICILDAEADTLLNANDTDYGHFTVTFRKTHDHGELAFNRRTNREKRKIEVTTTSVLLTGTPDQAQRLVGEEGNGTSSRFIFKCMKCDNDWVNQVPDADHPADDKLAMELFREWGERWEQVRRALSKEFSQIEFFLDKEQTILFNERLAQIQAIAIASLGDAGRSIARRLAIQLQRFMAVIALLRPLDELLVMPVTTAEPPVRKVLLASSSTGLPKGLKEENLKDGVTSSLRLAINNEDFQAVLSLAEPFYRHAAYVSSLVPKERLKPAKRSNMELLVDALPNEFSRKEAVACATELKIAISSMDIYLGRLCEKGLLEKVQRGTYRFTCAVKS
jgi:hypothetical protein